MARNEEKARSMLNRYITTMKQEEKRNKPQERRRPCLASECGDVADAKRWHSDILREIGAKVTDIQNEGLGEPRLRDLNDEINKLLRERGHWERRVVELGGHGRDDYSRIISSNAPLMTDLDGNIVAVPNPSGRGPGYRYFGAARKLPGVRELFDKPPPHDMRKRRRTGYEIHKRIIAGYYGFRDDEDGVLERLEAAAEKRMREEIVSACGTGTASSGSAAGGRGGEAAAREVLFEGVEEEVEEEERKRGEEIKREREKAGEKAGREFVAHDVPLPDEEEIERMVLERKKKELLSKYASDSLLVEEEEAMEMLNVRRRLKMVCS